MKAIGLLILGCYVAAGAQDAPAPPQGQVLFQSHGEPATQVEKTEQASPEGPELTDAERSSVTVTSYDLDARITPVTSKLAMRAQITVRNDGTKPLDRVALQVSSTLTWESVTLAGNRLELSQHLLDTDADHTGKANEAVVKLPSPLEVGKSVELDAFYSGTIAVSSGRLDRLGATRRQALDTDWDAIGETDVALRGFGDVLWYPVASPQLFLGEGAQLFQAIGATKLRESAASIRLRLSVMYKGEPPVAAYFCGRRQALKAISDDDNAPIVSGSGVATAEFAAEPLGFRVPSLFVVEHAESVIAPLPLKQKVSLENSSTSTPEAAVEGAGMLAVEAEDESSYPALAASAEGVVGLVQEWLGVEPLSALTVVDHAGQPFEDGPLLVAPVAVLATADAKPALVHSLAHAWVQTGQPWMDEGLAEFLTLLWTEREKGREAAVTELQNLMQPVSIAEPAIEPGMAKDAAAPNGELVGQVVGQPLVSATSELYYRRKAAAVWWMLRGIVGDEALQAALQAWRVQPVSHASAEEQAVAFEKLLEKSGKNAANPITLHWFFEDWVLHDRGLPDLTITDVTPRLLPAGQGHNAGWLVAVTVRNDGAAAAEVPVTIRAATFSTTSRLRIAGFASATARVLVEAEPKQVLVNDGGTPEVRTASHEMTITARQP